MIPQCKKNKNIYSTEEKVIGVWKNGKPIYRRITEGVLDGTYKENGYTFTWIDINRYAETQIDVRFYIDIENGRRLTEGSKFIDYLLSTVNTLQVGCDDTIVPANSSITIISEYTKNTD